MKTGGCSQSEHRSHSSMPAPVSYLYSPAISFCCGNHNSAVSTQKKEKYQAEEVCLLYWPVFYTVWIAQFTKRTASVLRIQTLASGFLRSHMTAHVQHRHYMQVTCDLARCVSSAARRGRSIGCIVISPPLPTHHLLQHFPTWLIVVGTSNLTKQSLGHCEHDISWKERDTDNEMKKFRGGH